MADQAQYGAPGEQQARDFDAVKAHEHAALGLAAQAAARAGAIDGAGLALSGGGIRSATFGLGVLQALAARGLLSRFDYLSTVSGGGYIGAWLSAWIHRAGLAQVETVLGCTGGGGGAAPQALEPEQVSWLRRYSNYLTPRVGLFSVDSLTLITIWTRNVTLSLIIVLAFFAVLLLLPRLALLYVTAVIDTPPAALGYLAGLMGAGVFPAVLVANMVELERPPGAARFRLGTTPAVWWTVLLPGVLAALSGSFWLFGPDQGDGVVNRDLARWSAGLLLLVGLGWLLCKLYHALRYAPVGARARMAGAAWRESAVFLPSGATGIGVGMAALAAIHGRVGAATGTAHAAAVLTFGPALFLLAFGAGGAIFVGLVGRSYVERSREWWSRMNAWFIIIGAAWLLLHGCAFYVPALVQWAYGQAGPWLRGVVGAGWAASIAGLLLAPRQGNGDPRRLPRVLTVAKLAAALFLAGFVVAAASLTDWLLACAGRLTPAVVPLPSGVAELDWRMLGPGGEWRQHVDMAGAMPGLASYVAARMTDLDGLLRAQAGPLPLLWLAFGGALAVLLVFGLRVDVNKFSLHNMYKTRLIRCYLGASNPHRRAQPFTGFDDGDDIALSSLADGARVQRPLHIVNAALNLSQGKNLAWQERKAASFTLTALYAGFALGHTQGVSSEQQAKARLVRPGQALDNGDDGQAALAGYRPTRLYAASNGETRAFTLGMAAATSGAAASPNMGAATSPALAFLLTVLNVRIGRWSPNPARAQWRRASPRFGLLCLLQELFGYSNDESSFVYLSDGGHFDNTGIYELVRRRCRLIVLVDASEDGRRGFDDLGRAIRQCRIDFGVEIRIDLAALRASGTDLPACGHARGEILYGSGAGEGELLYIKPTLCAARREPVDVLNYSSNHPSFPHQSPADQFFDESQFESYRQLGLHIGGACLDQHAHLLSNADR